MSFTLGEAVEECSVDCEVKRHLSVGIDKGRKVDPRSKTIPFRAAITPITGQDLKRLGMGQRVEGTMLIIAEEELFTAKSSPCRLADILTYKDVRYQIAVVNDWEEIGGFFECVGTRLDR